jgi:hypothetical protein
MRLRILAQHDMKLEEYSTASSSAYGILHAGLTLSNPALEQPHALPSVHAGSRFTVMKVTEVGGCKWDRDQFGIGDVYCTKCQ